MPEEHAELHAELRAVVRDLLAKTGPDAAPDWRTLARSGWLGLEAPEELDGAGASFAETAVVLHEFGRAAARGPYPAVAALALGALTLLEPSPGRDGLIEATVAGRTVPILALDGEAEHVPFRLLRTATGLALHGAARFVQEAPAADRLLLPALDPAGTPVLVDLPARTAGLTGSAIPVLDETRTFGEISAQGPTVPEDSVLRFADEAKAVRRLHDRAAVALACDSLGSAEAMLDATVAYAGTREQFGRRIGSFQAVKHLCADMLVKVEVARHLVGAAVRAEAGEGDPVAAAMAKSHACAAAVEVAGTAMQLHGGMGYTWESGIHVHLKRVTLDRELCGSPAAHRRRLADRYPALARGEAETYTSR
ncbi:alkylation response protein AidB-like acyl-CoA dehydrogenase [Actinocorallia herbida]|uniref:Alkylation response protein AidB-like acyl-CoA dehydrogenase n=1 Tax=Actinocorallia herbida TaxID=58109 RepID=A0A3N1CXE3_9ACTN|nr:acyl-CoA dehydrogenase family protein [Actinocorallia herbida]ROO85916.1 alkylation response protein AidB-like acyl-CoA dehydrogenase [Actinocorallia herbida]